jgi:hypothetical protein
VRQWRTIILRLWSIRRRFVFISIAANASLSRVFFVALIIALVSPSFTTSIRLVIEAKIFDIFRVVVFCDDPFPRYTLRSS